MYRQLIHETLRTDVARILKTDSQSIDMSLSLGELGIDSLGFVEIAASISKQFAIALHPEALFEHKSLIETTECIRNLIEKLSGEEPPTVHVDAENQAGFDTGIRNEKDIAIIGIALRLPGGVEDMNGLRNMIAEGASQWCPLPVDRLPIDERKKDFPEFLRGGFIDGATDFDATFFGVSPREAMAMDPQQRLLLECAWHAFEDAGLSTARLSGSNTAVFVGASGFDYYELLLRTKTARSTHVGTGVSHAILANRLSQYFNLTGASETIDCACASSLVALWRGVEALRRGDSKMALIGGVNLLGSRSPFQFFADAGMLSPSAECLPFDEAANGYVRGEGVVCVVLKPAATALREGNRIMAVIKGGAVRHSGRTQSLTAPDPQAQANAIKAAIADAQINPESIGYIEAHGTGTPLGDPIEIYGLKQAFAGANADHDQTAPPPHFFIGSIKSQIGHLEAAAGLAGLVKVVSALEHGEIPGSAYLKNLNHFISLEEAAFRIPLQACAWQEGAHGEVRLPAGPRRAGVSSFGFGGTNAHVILEQAPERKMLPTVSNSVKHRIFVWSAKSDTTLKLHVKAFVQHLTLLEFDSEAAEFQYLDNMAFTLCHGRSALKFRLAIIAVSRQELLSSLQNFCTQIADQSGCIFIGNGNLATTNLADTPLVQSKRFESLSDESKQNALIETAIAWTKGGAIDCDLFMTRGEAGIVRLPHYPFERKRFWVTDAPASTLEESTCDSKLLAESGIESIAKPRMASASVFYESRWAPALLDQANFLPWKGAVSFLLAGPRGRQVAKTFQYLTNFDTRVIDGSLSEEIEAVMAATNQTAPAALLDLTPFDEAGYHQWKVPAKLSLLRHIIGGALKRGGQIKLIQVTCGLKQPTGWEDDPAKPETAPSSLAGAQDTAFFANLSAEYKHCESMTVDFAIFEHNSIARHLMDELQHHDKKTCLMYRQGERWTQIMERIPTPQPAGGVCEGGVALITGGTGDIGLHLAEDLAARGFRALLLTGRSKLSADKNDRVEKLRKAGVSVSLYQGALTDSAALRADLDVFRFAHGPVTHVFHCAGVVDTRTPAFFQKTEASIATVMEPKVDALLVLHEIFVQEPPEFFVLFSSVSAVAPGLAAGALDYSAANRFLDHFAEYQHAQGKRYYRSIQWTRWQNTGLAKHAANIDDNGCDHSLAPADCFDALQRVLAQGDAGNPTVCVLAENDNLFSKPSVSPVSPAPSNEKACPKPDIALSVTDKTSSHLRRGLLSLVAKELEISEEMLDEEADFEALGIDSIILIGLITGIESWLGLTVEPHKLINCNSIASIAHYLEQQIAGKDGAGKPIAAPPNPTALNASTKQATHSPNLISTTEDTFKVAVIGIACNFPGAPNKDTFWRNLHFGIDSVGQVPASRWNAEEFYSPNAAAGKSISRWGGFIDGIEEVVPSMFGMNAEDAADVDPLIRLFTECCLTATADSPYGPDGLRGKRVGVFAGARASQYADRIVKPKKHSITGIGQNFVAAFTSHLLDLHGPSLVLDSACSSSLAAIHLACQSLRGGDSELALAGGVEVLLDEQPYLFLSAAAALSPEGRCRPLDAKANGFVPGEGVGCVLLKPLASALADGDPIYAVIEGSAMNNDGHTLGITTPGVSGQVDVIERALRSARVSAREISYVETHGTGTLIGDPIELQALTKAFDGDPPARCGVGSVKSNVGHLLSAAGVASFIKVIMSLHHKTLPPTLHVNQVNPRFNFENTPFYPVQQAIPWVSQNDRLLAGISAFGFGKTNVHMIVSQPPEWAVSPSLNPSPIPILGERIWAWHQAKIKEKHNIEIAAQMVVTDIVIEELT